METPEHVRTGRLQVLREKIRSRVSLAQSGRSSLSDDRIFNTYDLQRALNSTIHTGVFSKKDLKDEAYREYMNARHDHLIHEVDIASQVYNDIAAARGKFEDGSDLSKVARLNKEYLKASNWLAKAKLEYHTYSENIEELRSTAKTTRDQAELWNIQKAKDSEERHQGSKEGEQVRRLQDKVKDLERLQTLSSELDEKRAALHDHDNRQRVTLIGELSMKEWEIVALNQQLHQALADAKNLETQNEHLRAEIKMRRRHIQVWSGKIDDLREENKDLRKQIDDLHGEDDDSRAQFKGCQCHCTMRGTDSPQQ